MGVWLKHILFQFKYIQYITIIQTLGLESQSLRSPGGGFMCDKVLCIFSRLAVISLRDDCFALLNYCFLCVNLKFDCLFSDQITSLSAIGWLVIFDFGISLS